MGADYCAKTNAGNTVLHLAANVGEVPILSVLAKALMRSLDLDSRNSDGQTAAEKVTLRDEAPEGFAKPFERLVQSILDERFEACGWANSPASAVQSWHSLEEMNWYEAEAVVAEDVDSVEKEADMVTY